MATMWLDEERSSIGGICRCCSAAVSAACAGVWRMSWPARSRLRSCSWRSEESAPGIWGRYDGLVCTERSHALRSMGSSGMLHAVLHTSHVAEGDDRCHRRRHCRWTGAVQVQGSTSPLSSARQKRHVPDTVCAGASAMWTLCEAQV
eukprot:189700-Prymnesium_polylepis.1